MTRHRTVVMSVHPKHASRIYTGEKCCEFRRRAPGLAEGDKILFYETAPISAVTGEAMIRTRIEGPVQVLCESEIDPVARDQVRTYLDGAHSPVALVLCDVIRYDWPLRLAEVGVARAPQSYQYVVD